MGEKFSCGVIGKVRTGRGSGQIMCKAGNRFWSDVILMNYTCIHYLGGWVKKWGSLRRRYMEGLADSLQYAIT